MAQHPDYAEQVGELRRHLAEPTRGIILLEFANLPQLESILAGIRAIDPKRACLEVPYDPPREDAAAYLDRLRGELLAHPSVPLPLLVLRPAHIAGADADHPAAMEFWRALNFRRESMGALPAQILLCVDPWHHDRLLDYASDLRTWAAPKFHLFPLIDANLERSGALGALSSFANFDITPRAAAQRWETFWPTLEKASAEHRVQPGHFRRLIFPLFEAALATGNLVHARRVRDAARDVPVPGGDLVKWHELNGMLACAAQDFAAAEDHGRELLRLARGGDDQSITTEAISALLRTATLLDQFGCASPAEDLLREGCGLAENTLGATHPHTLGGRNNLAIVLKGQAKHPEAEQENRAVLRVRERLFGSDHRETLVSRNNLATCLAAQGKHAEAEQEHRAIMAIRQRVLGPEHPDTLSSRNNVAAALANQGKNTEAEREHRAVLEVQERVLGGVHPATLRSRNNLAVSLDSQQKSAEAEREHRLVVATRRVHLGEEHPETLRSRNNLAVTLAHQGRHAEAEIEYREILASYGKLLGEDHPDTLGARYNLANGLRLQRDYIAALREHRIVLVKRERALGENEPAVFESCYQTALCLRDQNQAEEALRFARRAVEGWKSLLGEEHRNTRAAQALVQKLTRVLKTER